MLAQGVCFSIVSCHVDIGMSISGCLFATMLAFDFDSAAFTR